MFVDVLVYAETAPIPARRTLYLQPKACLNNKRCTINSDVNKFI